MVYNACLSLWFAIVNLKDLCKLYSDNYKQRTRHDIIHLAVLYVIAANIGRGLIYLTKQSAFC
jgi:hypothetical protein